EDGIRDDLVTGVQTCALPILETTPQRLPFLPARSGFGLRLIRQFLPSCRSANESQLFRPWWPFPIRNEGVGQSSIRSCRRRSSRSEERRVGKECRCREERQVE